MGSTERRGVRAILFACVFLVHSLAFSEDLGGVAGEIRGIDGKPAKAVRVAVAFAVEEPNGELVPARAAHTVATTDDFGRYRLSNITPDRYFLIAGRIDTPSYYPGTKDRSDARLITIASGSTTEGLNFQLALPPGPKLTGRVTTNGMKLPRRITLFPSGPFWFREDVDVAQDGSFVFHSVPPGSYSLNASDSGAMLWNASSIVVGDKDVTGVRVSATPWVQASGWVEVEGGGPLPALTLELRGKSGKAQAGIGIIPESGVFIMNLPAGDYRVAVKNLPSEYRVESFTYGKTDLLKQAANFSGGVQRFTLKLSLAQPSRLRRIRGRVVGVENLSTTVYGAATSQVTLSGPSLLRPMQVQINRDGTYEFSNVRQGNYTLQVGYSDPASVVVADQDQNMDLLIPPLRQLRGRVVVADGGPVPMFEISFVRDSKFVAYGTSRAPGTFDASLSEGESRIRVSGFPTDTYELQAITFGSSDLLKTPLRVSGADLPEIVVTLRMTKPAVRVAGRVLDASGRATAPSLNPRNPSVYLSTRRLVMRATIAADGSFEFPKVPPGTYTMSSTFPLERTITIADQNIDGLEIRPQPATPSPAPTPSIAASSVSSDTKEKTVRLHGRVTASPGQLPSRIAIGEFSTALDSKGQFEFRAVPPGNYWVSVDPYLTIVPRHVVVGVKDTGPVSFAIPATRQIRGRVIVEGGGPLPRAGLRAVPVTAPSAGAATVESDGTFVATLPYGEFQVEMTNIAAPYRVKSMQYGSLDLMHQKLNVTEEGSQEIVVTVESVDSAQLARVAGRVTGGKLPASAKVALIGSSARFFIESRIEADGTFDLPRVPHGTYILRTEPPTFGMADRPLSVDRDISTLDVVVPEQRLLTVRIRVDGGGQRGGFGFSLMHSDGKGFQFSYPSPLTAPLMISRVDLECISDVCSTARLGRLLNEPVALTEGSTPETFTLKLPEGEYRMVIGYLSEGVGLRSMTFGPTNLMKENFKLTGENSPEIIITLAR
jgi:hypothetical protein